MARKQQKPGKMLKAAWTAYFVGLSAVFSVSALYFAFQIFRPDIGREEIWRGDPDGPPPSKRKIWAAKILFFLFLVILTLFVAAIWPLFPFIALGVVLYQRITEKRQDDGHNAYRR